MKKTLLLFFVSILLLAGCGSSTNPPSPGDDPKNELVLHGKANPSNSLGNDYDIYINETSLDLFQKNGGKWIPTETKGNKSFFDNAKRKEKMRDEGIDESSVPYQAIVDTFLCTNNQVIFEMFYGLPHDYTSQDLERAMCSYARYTFDSGKMITEVATSKEDLDDNKLVNSIYGYYNVENNKHYYSIDNNSWDYIDPNNPSSATLRSVSTTCADKMFEFSGLDNGLAGLFVGKQYTKESDKYVFSDIPLTMSILADSYENFKGTVNGAIALSEDEQYVSDLTIELVWGGDLIGQEHLEGVSLINCEFSGFKSQNVVLNNIDTLE